MQNISTSNTLSHAHGFVWFSSLSGQKGYNELLFFAPFYAVDRTVKMETNVQQQPQHIWNSVIKWETKMRYSKKAPREKRSHFVWIMAKMFHWKLHASKRINESIQLNRKMQSSISFISLRYDRLQFSEHNNFLLLRFPHSRSLVFANCVYRMTKSM